MKVAVWDTYVLKKDGKIMHFDIIVPNHIKDESLIFEYGKRYLKSKDQEGQTLTSQECQFCHIKSVTPQWKKAIDQDGYAIIEMENCK